MKRYIGHVKTDVAQSETEFEFEVEDDADEEDIQCEMEIALWATGAIETWCEPAEEDAHG